MRPVDDEAFIRTPLSTNGFYRIGPDGKRRWEEFVVVKIKGTGFAAALRKFIEARTDRP